jgi:hypothetical protein
MKYKPIETAFSPRIAQKDRGKTGEWFITTAYNF